MVEKKKRGALPQNARLRLQGVALSLVKNIVRETEMSASEVLRFSLELALLYWKTRESGKVLIFIFPDQRETELDFMLIVAATAGQYSLGLKSQEKSMFLRVALGIDGRKALPEMMEDMAFTTVTSLANNAIAFYRYYVSISANGGKLVRRGTDKASGQVSQVTIASISQLSST